MNKIKLFNFSIFVIVLFSLHVSFALSSAEKDAQVFLSVSANNLEQVKLLVAEGVDLNCKNDLLEVPLIYAKSPEMIDLLISNGADPNLLLLGHKTVLMRAIENDNNNLASILIDKGVSLSIFDVYGETAFLKAVKKRNMPILKKMFAKGFLNQILASPYRDKLFEQATQLGNEEFLKEAANYGLDLNVTNNSGQTFLMNSIMNNNIVLANFLMGRNVKLDPVDNFGKTALHYAVENGNQELIKKIIANQKYVPEDILVNAYDDSTIKFINSQKKYSKIKYQEFLIKAIDADNSKLTNYILSQTISINYQDNNGRTALIAAVQTNNLSLIKILLKRGSNPNLIDKNQNPALVYARDQKIIELLLSSGANLNLTEKDKKISVLTKAVSQDNKILVDYLSNKK